MSGIQVLIPESRWLAFLEARTRGETFPINLGKLDEAPRLPRDKTRERASELDSLPVTGEAWIVCARRLRGVAPIVAVDTFATVGTTIHVAASRFEPRTVDETVAWFMGWRDVPWLKAEEKPFAAWAWAGLSDRDLARARELGASIVQQAAPPAAPAASPRAPAPATKAQAPKAWEPGGDAVRASAKPAPVAPPPAAAKPATAGPQRSLF